METTIDPNEIYWETKYTNTENKVVFDKNSALALLLINEVVHLNSFWWKYKKLGEWIPEERRCETIVRDDATWTEEESKLISLHVECSDVFAWGCSDSEELLYEDLQDVYDHWIKDPSWGHCVWVMKKRNELPQKPVYVMIQKEGIWDLDSLGLEPNGYDTMLKEIAESKEK